MNPTHFYHIQYYQTLRLLNIPVKNSVAVREFLWLDEKLKESEEVDSPTTPGFREAPFDGDTGQTGNDEEHVDLGPSERKT